MCQPQDAKSNQAKLSTPHGIFFDFEQLFSNFCNVTFVHGMVTDIKAEESIANITYQQTQQHDAVPFDFAVVSVGCAYGSYSQGGFNPYFFCKPFLG